MIGKCHPGRCNRSNDPGSNFLAILSIIFALSANAEDFRSKAPITLSGTDPFQRIELPFEAYRDTRRDLGDLRVLNAKGEAVPLAFVGEAVPERETPVNVRLPKVVKAPEGHTYAWTENPLGINGYYLVSRGEKTPWRLKLRTASYANVQALSTLIPGCLVPDLIAILGSMFFVVGDIDK